MGTRKEMKGIVKSWQPVLRSLIKYLSFMNKNESNDRQVLLGSLPI